MSGATAWSGRRASAAWPERPAPKAQEWDG